MAAAAATNPAAIPSPVASGAMPRPGIDGKQDDDNDRRIIFCQCGIPLHWKSFHEGMADSDFELVEVVVAAGGCHNPSCLFQVWHWLLCTMTGALAEICEDDDICKDERRIVVR